MTVLTIDRKDIEHAKRACAIYDIEVYFSEHTNNTDKTLMVITKDLATHQVWYLARYFQTEVMEARFKALL